MAGPHVSPLRSDPSVTEGMSVEKNSEEEDQEGTVSTLQEFMCCQGLRMHSVLQIILRSGVCETKLQKNSAEGGRFHQNLKRQIQFSKMGLEGDSVPPFSSQTLE